MGVNLSIKDVPDDVAQRLRQRAAANHRSLQGELMSIVTEVATRAPPAAAAASAAAADRAGVHVQGWKTVEDLLAERAASGWQPHPSMASAPLGVDIIRADRDAR